VHVYHVYGLALVLGLVTVLDKPARQTFVSDMVGPHLLRNAVSLNSANFQSARMIGPALAGGVIIAVGPGWAFLLNGLAFAAPVVGLLRMRTAELIPAERVPRGKGQLREGLRYVGSRPALLWSIVLVGVVGTFGYNFPVFVVAFNDEVFHGDAGSYGLLNSLVAAGAVVGALVAAKRGGRWIRLMLVSGAVFGALLVMAAGAPSYLVFAVLMVPGGVASMTFVVMANSGIQLASDPAVRGRVVSLFTMVFLGSTPIGGPLTGWLTDAYGPRVGLAVSGAACVVASLVVALILARVGGLRLRIRLRAGRRVLALVPRDADADGGLVRP
jgi:MFS family permease